MTIVGMIKRFKRKLRNTGEMAKNAPKKGRSVRNGNSPSPYTKYEKVAYRYSPQYYSWKTKVTGRAHKYDMHA